MRHRWGARAVPGGRWRGRTLAFVAPETTPSAAASSPGLPAGPVAEFELRHVLPSDPRAQVLIEEVQGEYVRRYGSRDDAPVRDVEFSTPHGAFFLGLLVWPSAPPEPVATGAWRALPELVPDLDRLGFPDAVRPAEVKRMYVRPSAQRRGLARRVLAHVEADAAAAGHDLLVLGTGDAQPEAMALYESSGYREIAGFGYYRDTPGARHYAKLLT